MCDPITIGYMIMAGTASAVSTNQQRNVTKAAASAADTAANLQANAFAAAQQAFTESVLPSIPDPAVIQETAKAEAQKRRALAAQTILTSPVGILNEPPVYKKTLLGQ